MTQKKPLLKLGTTKIIEPKNNQNALAGLVDEGESRVDTVNTEDEHGGPAGLEPTRYGDWEKRGRCIDF